MKKRLSVLLMSAAMVSGVEAFAQAPAGHPDRSTASLGPSATTLRMGGTIDKYDASTGDAVAVDVERHGAVPLASTARIRQGWHRIDAAELEKLAGYRAAVRYSESGGRKAVESIHVFGKNERGER